jgi:hypothetical protein
MPQNSDTTITPAPAAVQDAEKAKVEFSPEQQSKIQEIIDGVVSRHKLEIEALKAATPVVAPVAPTAPDLSRELDLTKAELNALKSQQQESAVAEQLREAAGNLFLDTALATRLMRDCVKIGVDGKPVVVNSDGTTPRLNAAYEPMTLAELAQHVANERKFLARGVVKSGIGSTLSQGATPVNVDSKLSEYFGAKSNGGKANALALKSPSEYRRLRSLAIERGLLHV